MLVTWREPLFDRNNRRLRVDREKKKVRKSKCDQVPESSSCQDFEVRTREELDEVISGASHSVMHSIR